MTKKRKSDINMREYLITAYQVALNKYFETTDMEMFIHCGQIQAICMIAKEFYNLKFATLDTLEKWGCIIDAGL